MERQWLLTLAPIVGLAANVLLQTLYLRLIAPARLFRSIVVGFAGGLASCAALTCIAAGLIGLGIIDLAGAILFNLALEAALGYGYFHFNNLGETARRVRILSEVAAADGILDEDELYRRYNAEEIIDNRLRRLLSKGQIVLRNGRYRIGKPTVLRMAGIMAWLSRFLTKKGQFHVS